MAFIFLVYTGMYQLSNYCFLDQNVPFSTYSVKMESWTLNTFLLYSKNDAKSFGRRGQLGQHCRRKGASLPGSGKLPPAPVTVCACGNVKEGHLEWDQP